MFIHEMTGFPSVPHFLDPFIFHIFHCFLLPYSFVWIYISLFVCNSTIHRHLGNFLFLIILTCDAIDVCIPVFIWTYGFLSFEYMGRECKRMDYKSSCGHILSFIYIYKYICIFILEKLSCVVEEYLTF